MKWRWRDIKVGDVIYSQHIELPWQADVVRLALEVDMDEVFVWIKWVDLQSAKIECFKYDPRSQISWILLRGGMVLT